MPEVSIMGEKAPAVQKMASASTRMVEGKIARAPLHTPQAILAEPAPPTPSIHEAIPAQPAAAVTTTGSGTLQQASPAKAAYLKVTARFSAILIAEGFPTTRLTNLKPFNQPRTSSITVAGIASPPPS